LITHTDRLLRVNKNPKLRNKLDYLMDACFQNNLPNFMAIIIDFQPQNL